MTHQIKNFILEDRLTQFGQSLSASQLKEFREILSAIADKHHEVTEIYRYADINLIPSKTQSQPLLNQNQSALAETKIKPSDKIGNFLEALQKNLSNLSEADRKKFVDNLEKG